MGCVRGRAPDDGTAPVDRYAGAALCGGALIPVSASPRSDDVRRRISARGLMRSFV
ncbi:hypothetical protein EMIT0111MI5_10407 [Burkholderia sp. IT-111MI5]